MEAGTSVLLIFNSPPGLELGIDNAQTVFCGQKFRGFAGVPAGVHLLHYAQRQPMSETAAGGISVSSGVDCPRLGSFIELSGGENEVVALVWDDAAEDFRLLESSDPTSWERANAVANARAGGLGGGGGGAVSAVVSFNELFDSIRVHCAGGAGDGGTGGGHGLGGLLLYSRVLAEGKKEGGGVDHYAGWLGLSRHLVGTAGGVKREGEGLSTEVSTELSTSSSSTSSTSSTSSVALANGLRVTGQPVGRLGSEWSWAELPPRRLHASDFPEGTPAAEVAARVSRYAMDRSEALLALLGRRGGEVGLLDEFQRCFLVFLYAQAESGLERWKALVDCFCRAAAALDAVVYAERGGGGGDGDGDGGGGGGVGGGEGDKETGDGETLNDTDGQQDPGAQVARAAPSLLAKLVDALAAQLRAVPRDFFVDAISGENFLRTALQALFETVEEEGGLGQSSAAAAADDDKGGRRDLCAAVRALLDQCGEHFVSKAEVQRHVAGRGAAGAAGGAAGEVAAAGAAAAAARAAAEAKVAAAAEETAKTLEFLASLGTDEDAPMIVDTSKALF